MIEHGDSRMSVAMVISNLEYGGAQRQVVELANHLDRARFDVHVCSLSPYVPLAARLDTADRRLHVIRKLWKFDVSVVPRLAWWLSAVRADIVHGFLFDAEIATRLAGRLARRPVVIGSERNTDYTLKPRQLMAYGLTRKCIDLTIANSNAGAAFNSRTLEQDPSKYRVVHNGVDTDRFAVRDGSPVRRELGIGDDELVIGMFASFKHQKNHPLFFSAARHVLDRHPRVRLLLVGDMLYGGMHGSDQYQCDVDALVDELGLRERCVFAGNREDVEMLYSACDVTVLPSLFEGTPNVLLESMSSGVPVVATDVSDNAYIVPHGQVGYVVPLGDAMAMADRINVLLGDAALRRTMSQGARRWVEQEFSVAKLAEKMAVVYEAAVQEYR